MLRKTNKKERKVKITNLLTYFPTYGISNIVNTRK